MHGSVNQGFRAALAITENDTTEYNPPATAIYVGTSGNLVLTINGVDVTFSSVPVGTHFFGPISKVKVASTAAALVLLFN